MTLVSILDRVQRLINELDVGGMPQMAFTNLVYETVENYHLFFGVKTRHLVQQIVYAMTDLPGNQRDICNMRTDIMARLERESLKVGGQVATLQYLLPLDENHLNGNPPMQRCVDVKMEDKGTQTSGTFQAKPVQAIILE